MDQKRSFIVNPIVFGRPSIPAEEGEEEGYPGVAQGHSGLSQNWVVVEEAAVVENFHCGDSPYEDLPYGEFPYQDLPYWDPKVWV